MWVFVSLSTHGKTQALHWVSIGIHTTQLLRIVPSERAVCLVHSTDPPAPGPAPSIEEEEPSSLRLSDTAHRRGRLRLSQWVLGSTKPCSACSSIRMGTSP